MAGSHFRFPEEGVSRLQPSGNPQGGHHAGGNRPLHRFEGQQSLTSVLAAFRNPLKHQTHPHQQERRTSAGQELHCPSPPDEQTQEGASHCQFHPEDQTAFQPERSPLAPLPQLSQLYGDDPARVRTERHLIPRYLQFLHRTCLRSKTDRGGHQIPSLHPHFDSEGNPKQIAVEDGEYIG